MNLSVLKSELKGLDRVSKTFNLGASEAEKKQNLRWLKFFGHPVVEVVEEEMSSPLATNTPSPPPEPPFLD